MNGQILVRIILVLIILFTPQILVGEKINIDRGEDTAYLPFRYEEKVGYNGGSISPPIKHPIHIYTSTPDSLGQYWMVNGGNSPYNSDDPVAFSLMNYPNLYVRDDDPVNLIVNDCMLYNDSLVNRKALIGVGYKGDSVWAFKLFPDEDTHDKLYLASGRDGTGDGKYIPNILICLIEDYDYDGKHEAFAYLTSRREDGPRILFCIELETLTLEWQLPISSEIRCESLHSCKDSINPAIVFVAGNPMQGYIDKNYRDRFAYLSKVNHSGEILYNKIIGVTSACKDLIQSEKTGIFYMNHEIQPVDPDSVYDLYEQDNLDILLKKNTFISLIDRECNIIRSIHPDDYPMFIFLHDYGQKEKTLITQNSPGVVKAYTTSLEYIGQSDPVNIYFNKLGYIDIIGHKNAIVFPDGIYTSKFKKLVHFPPGCGYFQPFIYDEDSNVSTVILSSSNFYSIGEIHKRSLIDLASVFYHRNQIYILMAFSGLLVGLIVMNFYRSKTKRNFVLIGKQKKELEATHQKLKEAQATIIEQEKYRQAQDIAGGFAHEIRNALSPARNALSKLKIPDESKLSDPDKIRRLSEFSDEAIERAIDLTRSISQYTKLEAIKKVEAVNILDVINNVTKSNQHRIDKQNVRITLPDDSGILVQANAEQLYIIFNNLLLNSLDALTETVNPTILIDWDKQDGSLVTSFSDNGSGIPKDSIDRIFDVFYSTKPDTGTGLGLAMAKKIIEMYDGSISVNSQPGGKTTFELILKISSI